jgi:hypothetical protein
MRARLREEHVRDVLLLPLTLPLKLRSFFGDRLTIDQAGARLRREIENREARFLEVARTRIYADRESPYARLLEHAGCELADLSASLRRQGLEQTLASLAAAGVYLTPSEFKGKEPVVRRGLSFRLRPEDLGPRGRRDSAAPAFLTQSSGSSNQPVRSVSSLAWQREETPAVGVFMEAHGLLAHRHAAYEPMIPGVGGIAFVMMMARFGVPLDRWFARPIPPGGRLEGAYFRVTAAELALAGRLFGPGFASPEVLRSEALERAVRWVEEGRRQGRPSCIRTVASSAARIARTATDTGASLEGCTFLASGEPLTVAKRRVIQRAGADVVVLWGYEPGPVYVGLGCARPAHGDEMHVLRHTLAVVEHPEPIVEAGGQPVRPLLFTTLYPTAARLQLNVSNGDYAQLSQRNCGCALDEAGLTLHVHQVGSYEKLTSEGLAYPSEVLFELLETTLPGEFGGGVGDYQILEEEDPGGQTYLTLLVDPAVGPIDERRVLERLLSALAHGSRGNRFMAATWREAGTLRVRRESPVASARGKVLPLRVARKQREAGG